jgi:hypothetical protein
MMRILLNFGICCLLANVLLSIGPWTTKSISAGQYTFIILMGTIVASFFTMEK